MLSRIHLLSKMIVFKHLEDRSRGFEYVSDFVRRRTEQWHISLNANKRTRLIFDRMQLAMAKTKPAVAFSFLRTCLNGWPTYEVMHNCPGFNSLDECKFCCSPSAQDNLKHYSHCLLVKAAFQKLNPPCDWIGGVEGLLGLSGTEGTYTLIFKLRFVYAVNMSFNFANHHPGNTCNIPKLIVSFFKQSKWKR